VAVTVVLERGALKGLNTNWYNPEPKTVIYEEQRRFGRSRRGSRVVEQQLRRIG